MSRSTSSSIMHKKVLQPWQSGLHLHLTQYSLQCPLRTPQFPPLPPLASALPQHHPLPLCHSVPKSLLVIQWQGVLPHPLALLVLPHVLDQPLFPQRGWPNVMPSSVTGASASLVMMTVVWMVVKVVVQHLCPCLRAGEKGGERNPMLFVETGEGGLCTGGLDLISARKETIQTT